MSLIGAWNFDLRQFSKIRGILVGSTDLSLTDQRGTRTRRGKPDLSTILSVTHDSAGPS
jgi:hypothetical protein